MNEREETIQKTLSRSGHIQPGATVSFAPLKGGYHNHVYRLQNHTTGQDWVVKQFLVGADNPMFPTLPDHEAAALKMFNGSGLAPDFVDYLPDAPGGAILLYRFVPGAMWDGDLTAAARLLYQTHHTPVVGTFRVLPTTPTDILAQAEAILSRVTNAAPFRQQLAPYFATRRETESLTTCLVHTDCGPGNMIIGPEGTCLIDWQCPGLGDPVEDLTIFVSPAIQILYGREPLTGAEINQFLQSYNDPAIRARFQRLNLYYRLRFMAYCVFRIEELAATAPEISARYHTAFTAELAYLEAHHR